MKTVTNIRKEINAHNEQLKRLNIKYSSIQNSIQNSRDANYSVAQGQKKYAYYNYCDMAVMG